MDNITIVEIDETYIGGKDEPGSSLKNSKYYFSPNNPLIEKYKKLLCHKG